MEKKKKRGGRSFIAAFGLFEVICRQKVYQRQSATLSEVVEPMISSLMVTISWPSLVPILV
jgi:hypothetical protein